MVADGNRRGGRRTACGGLPSRQRGAALQGEGDGEAEQRRVDVSDHG